MMLCSTELGVPVVTGGAMVTNVPVSANLPVVVKILRLIAVTSRWRLWNQSFPALNMVFVVYILAQAPDLIGKYFNHLLFVLDALANTIMHQCVSISHPAGPTMQVQWQPATALKLLMIIHDVKGADATV